MFGVALQWPRVLSGALPLVLLGTCPLRQRCICFACLSLSRDVGVLGLSIIRSLSAVPIPEPSEIEEDGDEKVNSKGRAHLGVSLPNWGSLFSRPRFGPRRTSLVRRPDRH